MNGFELTKLVVIGTDCIGNCKSNYLTITTTTDPLYLGLSKNESSQCNLNRVWCLVFNATFYNISVILWQLILLVEEIGVPRENHRLIASH